MRSCGRIVNLYLMRTLPLENLKATPWSLAVCAIVCLTMATASSLQVSPHITTIMQVTRHSMPVPTNGSKGMLARQEQVSADCDIARPSTRVSNNIQIVFCSAFRAA